MHKSRRARRMERHHNMRKTPAINLVSLMDIFTILVFFLLVNSSSSQQLPSSKDLKLPSSISQTVPEETLTIVVTPREVLVQGVSVALVSDVLQDSNDIIPGLKDELTFLASRETGLVRYAEGEGRPITIMGDENIPYELVSKILRTCQQTEFTRVAFAASQRASSAN